MSKHTKGPWTYDGANSITADFMDVGICILEPIEEFWCGDVNRHPEGEEYEANARLIAAAPEMLAALQKLLHYADRGLNCNVCCFGLDGQHCGDCPVPAVRAALAKAKG